MKRFLPILLLALLARPGAAQLQSFGRGGGGGGAGSGFEAEAALYFEAAGVTNVIDKARIDGGFKALKGANQSGVNLYDNLVEAWIGSTRFHPSTNKTQLGLKGAYPGWVTNNFIRNSIGLWLDHNSGYFRAPVVPNVPSNSLYIVRRNAGHLDVGGPLGYGTVWCLAHSNGLVAGGGISLHYEENTFVGPRIITSDGAATNATAKMYAGSVGNIAYVPFNVERGKYGLWACVNNAGNLTTYCQGVTNLATNGLKTGISVGTLTVGARFNGASAADALVGGLMNVIALFNKVLTPTEIVAAEEAFRWFEPETEDLVVLGDSTSTWSTALADPFGAFGRPQSEGWPQDYVDSSSHSNVVRLYNFSNGGKTTPTMTNYLTQTVGIKRPHGPQERSRLLLTAHINSILASETAANIYTMNQYLCRQGQLMGYKVELCDAMPGEGAGVGAVYTVPMQAVVKTFNSLLRSNPSLYDRLHRLSDLFPVWNTTEFYDVHPTPRGNLKIAGMFKANDSGYPLPWRSPMFGSITNAGASATNLLRQIIVANTLTNQGTSVSLNAFGRCLNLASLKNINLVYGSQNYTGPSGLFLGGWRMEGWLFPTGPTNQTLNLSATFGQFNTNVVAFFTQTNGIDTTLTVEAVGAASGDVVADGFILQPHTLGR